MKIFKLNCFIFAFFITQLAISQTYIVKPKTLNVRAERSTNSDVIAKIYENDTIIAISTEGDWIKISISEKQGFVNKSFLEEINLNKPTTKSGFKYGFKKAFTSSFIITLILFLGYRGMKGRVKDGRHSKGYRGYNFSFRDYIEDGIYALIISLVIALVAGIYAWVKTF